MFEYRQVLTRMQLGDTDRAIARAGLMGRRKAAQLRRTAEAAGWLDVAKPLPGDGELAVHLGSTSPHVPYLDPSHSGFESSCPATAQPISPTYSHGSAIV